MIPAGGSRGQSSAEFSVLNKNCPYSSTRPLVKLFQVGLHSNLSVRGRMVELLTTLGANHYIKHDIQPYLPGGYNNPMRVAQHH